MNQLSNSILQAVSNVSAMTSSASQHTNVNKSTGILIKCSHQYSHFLHQIWEYFSRFCEWHSFSVFSFSVGNERNHLEGRLCISFSSPHAPPRTPSNDSWCYKTNSIHSTAERNRASYVSHSRRETKPVKNLLSGKTLVKIGFRPGIIIFAL